ncbi:MAG TPA: hypothetical protein VJC05_01865, partial [Candidatus Andersenbacteria bacterium]|nr:hypothetical protein [Candidatus Andersenbacteria bacterium]
KLDARITLLFATEETELQQAFDEHREEIMQTLQADDVVGDGTGAPAREVNISGHAARLGVIDG